MKKYILFFFFISFLVGTASAAPTRVTDLTVTNVGSGSVMLAWTTPAPAANTSLMENDIRYSLVAVTARNWLSRTQAVGEPVPVNPGEVQSAIVTGLNPNTRYFVGLKVRDSSSWSLVSNVVSVTTSDYKSAKLVLRAPDPATHILGYVFCQSKVRGTYTNCIDVGNVTTYTFDTLEWGSRDWFVALAYYRCEPWEQSEYASECYVHPTLGVSVINSAFSGDVYKD